MEQGELDHLTIGGLNGDLPWHCRAADAQIRRRLVRQADFPGFRHDASLDGAVVQRRREVGLLLYLNLRGMQESIKVLLPIFIGFFLTHLILISYGVLSRADHLPALIPETLAETSRLTQEMGWVFAASLFLRAYSLGGGTYTGIEAVSNGLPMMREPRVETGKTTMLYVAVSLAFTAGGILLCYLLLRVSPEVAKLLKSNQNAYLPEIEEILGGRTVIVKSDAQLQQEKFDLA